MILSATDALYTYSYITPIQFLEELSLIKNPATASLVLTVGELGDGSSTDPDDPDHIDFLQL